MSSRKGKLLQKENKSVDLADEGKRRKFQMLNGRILKSLDKKRKLEVEKREVNAKYFV